VLNPSGDELFDEGEAPICPGMRLPAQRIRPLFYQPPGHATKNSDRLHQTLSVVSLALAARQPSARRKHTSFASVYLQTVWRSHVRIMVIKRFHPLGLADVPS